MYRELQPTHFEKNVSQTEIIDLRRQILKDFHTFCINEEAYNDFVEILISLEEDIVNKK